MFVWIEQKRWIWFGIRTNRNNATQPKLPHGFTFPVLLQVRMQFGACQTKVESNEWSAHKKIGFIRSQHNMRLDCH